VKIRSPQSLKVFDLSSLQESAARITLPKTTQLTKIAPPKSPPIDKETLSFFAARIEEKTSGAPFPKANKLTPAIVGESFKVSAILARAGEKYWSAVDPSK
jgi:hypothetical protein